MSLRHSPSAGRSDHCQPRARTRADTALRAVRRRCALPAMLRPARERWPRGQAHPDHWPLRGPASAGFGPRACAVLPAVRHPETRTDWRSGLARPKGDGAVRSRATRRLLPASIAFNNCSSKTRPWLRGDNRRVLLDDCTAAGGAAAMRPSGHEFGDPRQRPLGC